MRKNFQHKSNQPSKWCSSNGGEVRARFRVMRQGLRFDTNYKWLRHIIEPLHASVSSSHMTLSGESKYFICKMALKLSLTLQTYSHRPGKYKYWNIGEIPKWFEIPSGPWGEGGSIERKQRPNMKKHHACVGTLGADLEKMALVPMLTQCCSVTSYHVTVIMSFNVGYNSHNH